ncbi:phosphomevalonate kinase, partial [Lunasporangiospora selenospora]
MSATTVVSAPGKVLLAGGYLVLDRSFSGLVVATDARFYTLIRPITPGEHTSKNTIIVRSPQFENATWTYNVNLDTNPIELSASEKNESKNTFVELALAYSLAILGQLISREQFTGNFATGLEIVIAGNNDFYSQRHELEARGLALNTTSLRQIPLFVPTHTTLSKVHKTGLGSSAALITSLVSAIFVHFRAARLDDQDSQQHGVVANKAFLHNVAQFVHCFAQGKVGSGFDVSSAVWGSHTYRRFSPELLHEVMSHSEKQETDTKTKEDRLKALIQVLDPSQKPTWDNVVAPFRLAPGLHLMLADIDAGSHTPTLVSNVLKWRKTKSEEANQLWGELGAANDKVVELLKELDQLAGKDSETYQQAIRHASTHPAVNWAKLQLETSGAQRTVIGLLNAIHAEFSRVREYLREMSRLSQVPVEPEEQTRLLDVCMSVPGVLMAGVPGAGGFDAIFCIVLSEESRRGVEERWSLFKEMSVGPLLCKESVEGGLVLELEQARVKATAGSEA